MSRKLEEPVTPSTGVPVLVPAQSNERSDGIANFLRVIVEKDKHGEASRSDERRIREVTSDDIGRINEILGTEQFFLRGVLNLRQGYETDDEILRARGFELLEKGELSNFFGKHPNWARLHFSEYVTERIKEVRLVMWFAPRQQRFTPALFSPDLKTGVIVKALFTIRSCPHCGEPFVPSASNVLYCKPAHRDAYRVARKRRRDGIESEAKQQRKGAKHGKK